MSNFEILLGLTYKFLSCDFKTHGLQQGCITESCMQVFKNAGSKTFPYTY